MSNDWQMYATIRSQTLQLIVDITTDPKPTYYIDGQAVSWQQYLEQLQRTQDWCDAHLREDDLLTSKPLTPPSRGKEERGCQ